MSEMKREVRNRAARHESTEDKAQPVSEMERKVRNRAARHESTEDKAQPVSEMERKARNRAARHEPDGRKGAVHTFRKFHQNPRLYTTYKL